MLTDEVRWFDVRGTKRDANASIGSHVHVEAAREQATRQSIYIRRQIVVRTDSGIVVGHAHDGEWIERKGWQTEDHDAREIK